MKNIMKYYIEVVHEDVLGNTYLLETIPETKRFDTEKEALDWYHTSFVTADTWECSIRLVTTKYDKDGHELKTSLKELKGI